MSETTFNGGNSYGPQTATVQFAVSTIAGALGTFFKGGRRINRITYRNLEDGIVTIRLQENDNLGVAGWTDVAGSTLVIVGLGIHPLDIAGVIKKPYVRFFGVSAGRPSIVRATIDDMELIKHFFQNRPYYGVG
jgi:hypothetical protein